MDSKSIEWFNYLKLNQLSDAFIFSEKFSPFIEVEFSAPINANILENSKYTAGSTEDPDDFSLPDRSEKTNPDKLIRINAFNSSANNLSTYNFNNDTNIPEIFRTPEEEVFEDYVTEEAKQLLIFLKNKPGILEKKVENSITFGHENFKQSLITLGKRNSSSEIKQNNSDDYIRNTSLPIEKKENDKSQNKSQNVTNILNNNFENIEYVNNTQQNRVENYDGDIYYDIANSSSSVHNDFLTQNNNTIVINEMKTEVIQYIDESLTKIENNILHQTVNKQEIKQVKNEILQVFETKMQEKQDNLLEQIDKKTKKDISAFSRDFLNS